MLPHALSGTLLALSAWTALQAGPEPQSARPRNVAILLYPGVELLDFAGPGEVFASASGPAGRAFRVYTVARTRAPLQSQGFVSIMPEFSLSDCPAPDILVLPGGATPSGDRELVEWVRACAEHSELVLSVCTGAFLLAESGLLENGEATTHHGSLEELALRYPATRVLVNRRFVDSGRVMTCAGVSAGIDGALHVVERLLGADCARRTARYMEYAWRPQEIAAENAAPGITPADSPTARLVQLARERGVAAALAERARMLEPPAEAELNGRGYALLRTGHTDEARAALELAAAAFPDSANARDSLAEVLETLGNREDALRCTRETLERLGDQNGERADRIRRSATERLARLGGAEPGPQAARHYVCPPCGRMCDHARFEQPGSCPSCSMALTELRRGG